VAEENQLNIATSSLILTNEYLSLGGFLIILLRFRIFLFTLSFAYTDILLLYGAALSDPRNDKSRSGWRQQITNLKNAKK